MLNESFRQAWDRLFKADLDSKSYELAELLNLLEIVCASYLESSLTGNSRTLLKDYLDRVLSLLVNNAEIERRVSEELIQSPKTFKFIKRFLRQKRGILSVTIPPNWYRED